MKAMYYEAFNAPPVIRDLPDPVADENGVVVKVLATNVASFSITPDSMLGVPYYRIDVRCEPSHPKRKVAATELRGSVCSDFQIRLERNSTFIPNQTFTIDLPK